MKAKITAYRPRGISIVAGACCAVAMALFLTGCAGPPVLGQQVLGYDDVAKSLDEELLLLNVARVAGGEGVHFTSTSSIAATFDWTTTVGIGGQLNSGGAVADYLDLNLGASASENPTFSIVPVSGEEFTRRVVTPFDDSSFEFLVFQGNRINQVMRLMAGGIEVQTDRGAFVRFIENDPRRPGEYEEFRRIALHLQSLNNDRKLFVRSLVFDETLIADFKGPLRAEDINNGFDKGLRWRQKPNGNFELTRPTAGRVIVANYDPMAMSDTERFELNEKIRNNPGGFVHLDVRPQGPGGDLPVRGAIKLRSLLQILDFVARGIGEAAEFDVYPDPRSGKVERGARATLAINVTAKEPPGDLPAIRYRDRYYAVDDTKWDRSSFRMLNILFQTTVGDVKDVGVPVTISK